MVLRSASVLPWSVGSSVASLRSRLLTRVLSGDEVSAALLVALPVPVVARSFGVEEFDAAYPEFVSDAELVSDDGELVPIVERALRDELVIERSRSTTVSPVPGAGFVPGGVVASVVETADAVPSARAGAKFGPVLGVLVAASTFAAEVFGDAAGALSCEAQAPHKPKAAMPIHPSLLVMTFLPFNCSGRSLRLRINQQRVGQRPVK